MDFPTAKNYKKIYHLGIVFLMLFIFSSPDFAVAQTSTSLPQNFARTIFCGINNLLGKKSCKQFVVAPASDLVAGVSFIPSADEARPQIIQYITQPVIERSIHTKETIKQVLPEKAANLKTTEKTLAQFGLQLDQLSQNLYKSNPAYDDTALWRVIAQMNVVGVSSGTNSDDQSLAFDDGTSILTISGGNSVDLSALSGGAGSDDQTIDTFTLATNTLTLSLEGDGEAAKTIDLSAYLDNTDTLSDLSCAGGEIAKWSGTAWACAADASGAGGTDDQTIDVFTLSSNTLSLSLEGDAEATKTIDLSAYLDNTNTQLSQSQVGTYATSEGFIKTDTNTTYSAGTGLTLTGTTFSNDLGTSIETTEITNGTILDDDLNLTDITLSDFTNDANFITSADDTVSGTELDGVFSTTGLLTRTGAGTYSTITNNTSNWNTAFGWGDHSLIGYLTTVDISSNTNLTAGTGITLTGDTLSTTLGTSIDISDETNLAGDTEIILTGDTLSIASSIARDTELHNAATVSDSSELNFTLTGQDITASIITGSIDETKLDASTNTSLNLADSALQSYTETDPAYTAAPAASITSAGSGTVISSTERTKLTNIETLADVTDTTNVTAAGALMDSEIDADLKTLSLPTNTTISSFGATLTDDTTAAAARTTLGVDTAGTDNSINVTLAGSLNYITIVGQTITRNAIDLATDITGLLGITNGGTGASTASGARTNLGLAIGSDIQAFNANTTQIGQTIESNEITDNTVSASDLFVTGNGTAGQVLTSDADGSFSWSAQTTDTNTQLTEEQVEDFTGSLLTGTETGISVTYQDSTNDIDFEVTGILQDLNTLGAPTTDGQFIVATGTGAFAYESGATARSSLTLGNVENTALSTWAGTTNITTLGTITTGTWNASTVDISDYTNLTAGTGITLIGDTLSTTLGTSIDISDETNLTVSALGLTLTGDAISLSAGFNIPLSASTTEWSTAFGWGDHSLEGYITAQSDDQTIDTFGLSGDTLSLSLEADGEATKTVDLSSYAKDTDLHDAITLSGGFDYLTLIGQDIARGAIDLATDITGTLSVGNGGTGATTTALARSNLGLAIGANIQAFDSNTSLIGQSIETAEITNGTILGVDLDFTDITLADFTNDQSFISDGNSNWNNSYGFITNANDTVSGSELDGVFSASGLLTRTGVGTYTALTDNSSNWNTAFSWGDHASGGYLTGITGQSIKTLSDVYSSMTPTDGQVLTFDTTNGWQSETLPDGADHLGNHTATQALNLNGNWLSGDGDAEGLFVDSDGNVGIGTASPSEKLTIDGNLAFVSAAKNIIVNNTSAAWAIATSTSATPLFKIDTTSGSELVTLGKSGGSVIIGAVGSATNLVFEESAIIHGQGDNSLTFGQAGDKINFAVNVGIGAATPAYPLHMGSGAFVSTGGSWTNASSRDLKENFISLNPMDILASINTLNISQWNYKTEDSSILHIGPIAQDFFAEFGLGGSDVSISTIDTAGVALIGIQALTQKFDNLFTGFLITEDGILIAPNIETDNFKTKTFCLGSTCITEDAFRDLLDLEPLSEASNVENDAVDSADQIEENSAEDEPAPLDVSATTTTPLLEPEEPSEQASTTSEQTIEPSSLDEPNLNEIEQLSDSVPNDTDGEAPEEISAEPTEDEIEEDAPQAVEPVDEENIETVEPDPAIESEPPQDQS